MGIALNSPTYKNIKSNIIGLNYFVFYDIRNLTQFSDLFRTYFDRVSARQTSVAMKSSQEQTI